MAAERTPRTRRSSGIGTIVVFAVAGAAALRVARVDAADSPFGGAPFARFATERVLHAAPSANAFGTSSAIKLRQALPGESMEFPLEVSGDPSSVQYRWIPLAGSSAPSSPTAPASLTGARVIAPSHPGVYRLALARGGAERLIAEPVVAVTVPFGRKVGGVLNGYRIGTYLAERVRARLPGQSAELPPGFIEVTRAMVDLPVSRHLRLGDFLTHDAQDDVWPKYVALDQRLLDKVELVLTTLARLRGDSLSSMALDVHSGFRTPAHNARVPRSARESRHQYGDAADLAIDADRDGRVTAKDEVLIAVAVEQVEARHPELVGGLGLYASRRYRKPYVHIDARGTRSRWRG